MVPVDFLRGIHGYGQDDEDAQTAYEQGVALELHDDVDEGVEHREQQAYEKGCAGVAEEGAHEEGDEPDGHDGGDKVGEEEGEVLGEGQQEGVEEHEGDADKGVLDGVDGRLTADFDKEDHGKGEQDDEVGILDAAGGLLVLLDRNLEVDTEGLCLLQLGMAIEHLCKVAVEGQHFPVGIEALVGDLALGGEIASSETGCGTVGGQMDRGSAANGQEVEVVGAFEGHGDAVVEVAAVEERLQVDTAREGVMAAEMQGFGGELGGLAVENEGGIVGEAFEVADGKEELGPVGAEALQLFGFELFGQGEPACKREGCFVDGEVVDAAFEGAGVDVAVDVEGLGQDIEVVGRAVAGNEEHGTCEGLPVAPFLVYFEIGKTFGAAAFVHHVHDDGLRDEQQNADD